LFRNGIGFDRQNSNFLLSDWRFVRWDIDSTDSRSRRAWYQALESTYGGQKGVLILGSCDRQPASLKSRWQVGRQNYGDLRVFAKPRAILGMLTIGRPAPQLLAKIGISGLDCAPVSSLVPSGIWGLRPLVSRDTTLVSSSFLAFLVSYPCLGLVDVQPNRALC